MAATPANGMRGELAGLAELIQLGARRERIPLLFWIGGVGAVGASAFSAIAALYPDEAGRAALGASIAVNPAFRAMVGPVSSTSLGGLTSWRIGVMAAAMVGVMAVFTVVRRTRGDEEAGRTELLSAGVVGRSAQLVAALLTAGAAATLIGMVVAVAGLAHGAPAIGSLLLGAVLAGSGWVFAAVAAVAAQLTGSARTATAIAGAALGAGYAIRAVADSVDGWDWLNWLSPLGWVTRADAYGADAVRVLALFLAATVLLTGVAVLLLHRRDVGSAVFPARLGPIGNPRLSTPWALAVRLHRAAFAGWAAGFLLFGVVTGGIAASAADLIDTSPQFGRILSRIGGAGMLIDTFLAALGAYAGLLAGSYAIAAVLRMHAEETAGRVSPVLAGPVSRTGWLAGHLTCALAGAVGLLTVCGVVTGLVHGVRIGDLPGGISAGLGAMLIQIPPALIMGAVAMAVYGWCPHLSGAAWVALGGALVFGLLGRALNLPQALLNLSPYTHLPALPAGDLRWAPVIVELCLAATLVLIGITGFRRRDVT